MFRPGRIITYLFLILAAIALIIGVNCSDKKSVNSPEYPPLPPESSFKMAFDDFTMSGSPAKPAEGMTSANWGYAAVNVAVWNTILAVTLAVPVAAFLESFNHKPVLQSDGSWEWTYNFLGGTIYTARLNGKINGSSVDWNMYISKLNEYSDFLWYYGSSDIAGTSGTWTLNTSPQDLSPIPFLGIIWHYDRANNTGDLKYTNIVPDSPENGSYIKSTVSKDTPYNRTYTIHSASQNNNTNIEWDFNTKAGRVQDELHYGNDLWRCWDTNKEDITCP